MVIAVNLNLTDRNPVLGKGNKTSPEIEFPSLRLSRDSLVTAEKIFSQSIGFRGHKNILGTHRNTLEITKEAEISRRADCIVGVSATKSCAELDLKLAEWIKSAGKIAFVIKVAEMTFSLNGYGSADLTLSDDKEIVLRRSDFASPRTIAVQCDAAALDIPRQMIRALQNPEVFGNLEINAIRESKSPNLLPPIEFV
jgi:hypothetical protein